MMRFDKVIKPQGLITFRVGYTVILDEKGLYLIQTGPGFEPEGYTAGRGVAKVLSAPVIAMRNARYFRESELVEQQINQNGHADFPLGRRGAFLHRNEVTSVEYSIDKFNSAVVKLKTAKGKFKLAFYAGLHDKSKVEQFVEQIKKA